MNQHDNTFDQLQRTVDQIIAPLRASPARKSIMREELLAHLIDIYESESQSNPSPNPTALAATLRRFGQPTALTNDLQSTIPVLERIFSVIYNKENPMKNLWLTLLLAGIAGLALGLSLILPALAKLKLDGHLPGPQIALTVLGSIISYTGAQICCWGLARKIKAA